MAFNVFAVAALAGSALAACPLSVAIVNTVDHTATVAITNTGSEAVTVFKGNTVLSNHNTQDVFATAEGKLRQLAIYRLNFLAKNQPARKIVQPKANLHHTDGTDLEFMGTVVNYKKTGLAADQFQTIAAGATVNSTIDVSQTYALAGVETTEVTAIQGFKYITGTTIPTSTLDLATCDDVTSNTVAITPDQAKVAA